MFLQISRHQKQQPPPPSFPSHWLRNACLTITISKQSQITIYQNISNAKGGNQISSWNGVCYSVNMKMYVLEYGDGK